MTRPVCTPFPRRHFLGVPLVAAASAAMSSPGPQRTGDAPGGLRRLRHPGFLDLQVNGFAGVDFNDPATSADQVHHALAALRSHGVTQILPTIISGPLERYERCARTLLQANAPAILGLHMEGPYISPEDGARGAHRREDTAPASIDDFKRRQDDRRWTRADRHARAGSARRARAHRAPARHGRARRDRPHGGDAGAGARCRSAPARRSRRISATAAPRCCPGTRTSSGNSSPPTSCVASIIVDGHHLPPATVKSMVRAKTPRRVVLVTDAIAAAGQPPGDYRLGALTRQARRERPRRGARAAEPGRVGPVDGPRGCQHCEVRRRHAGGCACDGVHDPVGLPGSETVWVTGSRMGRCGVHAACDESERLTAHTSSVAEHTASMNSAKNPSYPGWGAHA